MLHFFADESCKDAHRYMAIGGVALEKENIERVLSELQAARAIHGAFGEVKWNKCSKYNLPFYKEFVDVFFDLAAQGVLRFHGLYVDTRTVNHRVWNRGDAGLGMHKLIYQLLLHRIGRRYGGASRIYVFLDKRDTVHDPQDMLPMLNSDLRKRWGVNTDPFRRIVFADSKKTDFLQLNDLLVGSVGYITNLHHRRPGCAQHKKDLAWYIARKAVELQKPISLNSTSATKFAVWRFVFKQQR